MWIVVIGSGVWAKCYGPFLSHDDAMAWMRKNQFDIEAAQVHPVHAVEA